MKYDGRTCQSHENITASPITILLPHSAVALSTEKLNPTVLAIIAIKLFKLQMSYRVNADRNATGVPRSHKPICYQYNRYFTTYRALISPISSILLNTRPHGVQRDSPSVIFRGYCGSSDKWQKSL